MNQRYRQNAKKLFVPIFDELQEITYLKRYYNYLDSKVSRFISSDLIPIFDELQEITYLKRYYNYLDSKVSRFVSSDLIRQEMEEKYND